VKDFLQYPGELDLSAYVNFTALKNATSKSSNIIVSEAIP